MPKQSAVGISRLRVGEDVKLREFQNRIEAHYGERDRSRGVDATFRWLVEEVGELARALREGDPKRLEEEIGDVLAWTVTVASLCGVDAAQAAGRYASGCPKCSSTPCACPSRTHERQQHLAQQPGSQD